MALLTALLVLASPAAAEWAMDGSDPLHSGEQATPLIGSAEQWRVQVDGELMCPPSSAYGKLFIGTSDGYLKVLDERDGRLIWDLELGGTVRATPLVESQTVFVPSENQLFAVVLTNRSIKWTFGAVGEFQASPVLYDDLILIGSKDKHIYAIDKYTGDLEWKMRLDDVVAASPSATGLTVVVSTEAGTVHGIHRTEGEELWNVSLGHAVSTAACISQSTAMVGTFEGRLHGIDIEDGEVLWSFPPRAESPLDPILTTPVTNSGLVYFGCDGLYCLQVNNGLEVWHFGTGDTVRGSPAIVESYLVFGCYDGLLRCLDKNTGKVIWRYRSDTVFRSSVSIDYDKAYIGDRDGHLHARSILNQQPPRVIGPFNLEVETHDSISFKVSAEDPEGNMLTYQWDFGDGNASTEADPLHHYPEPGEYTVTVTVSDGTKIKRHTIDVVVNPFEASSSGGDEARTPWALIGGGTAAVAVVALLLAWLLFLRSGGEEGDQGEGQGGEGEVVGLGDEGALDGPEEGRGRPSNGASVMETEEVVETVEIEEVGP